MQYKFYVQMDGETFGPYSAREVRDLPLMDDILVTEESMNEWLPACRFDFDDMVRKELGSYINEDGTINRPEFVSPVTEPETIQMSRRQSKGGIGERFSLIGYGEYAMEFIGL